MEKLTTLYEGKAKKIHDTDDQRIKEVIDNA